MSAFVKAAAYALGDQPAVNAGKYSTLKDSEILLCGVRHDCIFAWLVSSLCKCVCGEEKDLSFSTLCCPTSKPTITYLVPLDQPDLFT